MKTLFVSDLKPDSGRITEAFVVSQCDIKLKKDQSCYLALKLQDKTGDIVARLWEIPDDLPPIPCGAFVKVEGDVSTYKDALQLSIKRIRLLDRSEVSLDDFLPVSKRDRGDLLREVEGLIAFIVDPALAAALQQLIDDHEDALRDCPAAKKNHQPYLGGLLEHIRGIGLAAMRICEVYPSLNRDLLIAAAIIHDIGKLEELVWETHIGYSRIGLLVGHVTLGAIIWDKYTDALDPLTRDHLAHIIASHHGQKDWGAAKVPMTKEAIVFHELDMIDSRLHLVEDAIDAGTDAGGMTPYNNAMGTALWDGAK